MTKPLQYVIAISLAGYVLVQGFGVYVRVKEHDLEVVKQYETCVKSFGKDDSNACAQDISRLTIWLQRVE